MIKIEAYKCSHCRFWSEDEIEVERHEKECDWNPANKNCWLCKHYQMTNEHKRIDEKCWIGVSSLICGRINNCQSWEER